MKRIAAAALLCFAAAGIAAAVEEKSAAPVAADLAWMAGNWIRNEGESTFEETWLPPRSGTLAAVSRSIEGGKLGMIELSTVETGPEGELVLRIRHFGAGLAPWKSEAAGPGTWTLATLEKGKAVFEDAARDFPRTIVYASPTADEMTATLEGERGGRPMRMKFAFRRVK